MFKKLFLVGVASLFLAACSQNGSVKGVSTTTSNGNVPGMKKNVQLISKLTGKPFGTALVETAGENVHLFVQVQGAGTSVVPVSLNLGTCSDIKDVRYALNDLKSGNSDTVLNKTNFNDLQGLLVVIATSENNKTPSGCGVVQ